ncbi:MAG: DUF4382 domain-containing protein [Gemmatimonadota bacterium]|nr:DUF4382 domain-containing protein [Gemmatimonadota bacterium]
MTQRRFGVMAAMTAVAVATACADGAGLDGTSGQVEVTMQQAASSPAATSEFAVFLSANGSQGRVDPSLVTELLVTVTRIGFLPAEPMDGDPMDGDPDEDPDDTMWIWLELPEPVTLNLMALPIEADPPIVIAAGEVAVGDYRKVRMIVAGALVSFGEDVSVGQQVYAAAEPHEVTVPSGAQSGLKTDAVFSVLADDLGDPTEVNILFDPDATFKNVVATGSGKINLTPVIKSH